MRYEVYTVEPHTNEKHLVFETNSWDELDDVFDDLVDSEYLKKKGIGVTAYDNGVRIVTMHIEPDLTEVPSIIDLPDLS